MSAWEGGSMYCLDIEINERAGLVRVHDPRLFQAAQHSFCKRLLAAASEQREIRRAEVNLATATCWIEFGPDLGTSQALASAFILAVRQASAGTMSQVRRPWWQRFKDALRRSRYRRAHGGVCVPWEALELEPGRIAIDVQGLNGEPDQIVRLTESLAGLDAVEVCHVLPWSGRIAIGFRPDRPGLDRLLDGVERTLMSLQGERWNRQDTRMRTSQCDWSLTASGSRPSVPVWGDVSRACSPNGPRRGFPWLRRWWCFATQRVWRGCRGRRDSGRRSSAGGGRG
jgi:hypothetical protein